MIGNKYLKELFNYQDEDTSINQLLEFLKYKDPNFICSLKNEYVDLDICSQEEVKYLTIVSALIDYYLQIHELEIPKWIRDERLQFESPSPFRRRNTYFELDSILRV